MGSTPIQIVSAYVDRVCVYRAERCAILVPLWKLEFPGEINPTLRVACAGRIEEKCV